MSPSTTPDFLYLFYRVGGDDELKCVLEEQQYPIMIYMPWTKLEVGGERASRLFSLHIGLSVPVNEVSVQPTTHI